MEKENNVDQLDAINNEEIDKNLEQQNKIINDKIGELDNEIKKYRIENEKVDKLRKL